MTFNAVTARNNKPASHSGSTIVGAMISILIMSTGMTALYSLYINNTLNSAHSRHVSTAVAYARDKIETLRFESSNTEIKSGSEEIHHQNTRYQRNWNVIKNSISNYNHIDISMQWQDSSGNHHIRLQTLVADTSTEPLPFSQP